VEFIDNQDCLDCLEGAPEAPSLAVFPLIDEACRLPRATYQVSRRKGGNQDLRENPGTLFLLPACCIPLHPSCLQVLALTCMHQLQEASWKPYGSVLIEPSERACVQSTCPVQEQHGGLIPEPSEHACMRCVA
jgi:hypothetical protein